MTDSINHPIPQVDLKRQYASIKHEIETAVQKILVSGNFASGAAVAAFEREFAQYCGVRHCVCVNSGTSALHLSMIAAGIHAGDEVITVPFTFIATAWAISYVGATPIFVDIDPDTFTMDVEQLAKAIGPKTRAILPVHLYGQMADLQPIREACDRHGLVLIEDAAQALGARYREYCAGSIGDIGCFSFYPTKNLGACGEAGALTTNDDTIATRLRQLRDHAQVEKYRHEEIGYNYRMDEMQGAVLGVKLRRLEEWNEARRAIADRYRNALSGLRVDVPLEAPGRRHVWHQFVIRCSHRDALRRELSKAGISTSIHYPTPLHLQPVYKSLGYKNGDFPVAECAGRECLSLPIFPELTDDEVDRVCSAIVAATR